MKTSPLARTLCLIHPERPAAARCPACGGFFCGECITEHDGRLTCAGCLAAERQAIIHRRLKERRFVIAPLLQAALGLFLAWLMWQTIAEVLLSIPADFHDGTIWK